MGFNPGSDCWNLLFTPQRHECNPPNAVLAIVAARLRQLPLPRARLGGECFEAFLPCFKVCFFWRGKMAKMFEKPSFFWMGITNYSTLVTTKQKKLPEWSKMPLRSQFTVSKDFSSWSASSKAAASWACANLCCFSALRSAWQIHRVKANNWQGLCHGLTKNDTPLGQKPICAGGEFGPALSSQSCIDTSSLPLTVPMAQTVDTFPAKEKTMPNIFAWVVDIDDCR